jgi:hypothetical protein
VTSKENTELEKGISEIVGVFTDPIIVMPGGWGDTLPDWIKEAITIERLTMNVRAIQGGEMTGTDAEAVAYLYTASLNAPIDRDWTDIYLYITTQVMRRHRKVEVPADIAKDSITDYQKQHLLRLKAWIYRTRTRVRQDRDRAQRRERRDQEKARLKAQQPALFDF